jgi:CheY-like chemotaxis protein
MNLVVNARDAMPRGGKLLLQTAHVSPEAVGAERPPGLPAGNYVILAVSDSGIGMDAETRSRIFEPFFTTKSKDAGTGLGLSVVYNIVRGNGGQVTVSSELGRGSTFRIFLPRVAAPPTPRPVAEVTKTAVRRGTETVLVAEDQPDLRWMICQFLQDLGYSVLESKDGNDAVALAEQYRGTIDVLLTDVVMPEIRGPEVARRVSALRPNLKVIFMSGYTEGALDIRPGEQPPETALLQKPFDLNFMAGKICEVLESRSRT